MPKEEMSVGELARALSATANGGYGLTTVLMDSMKRPWEVRGTLPPRAPPKTVRDTAKRTTPANMPQAGGDQPARRPGHFPHQLTGLVAGEAAQLSTLSSTNPLILRFGSGRCIDPILSSDSSEARE